MREHIYFMSEVIRKYLGEHYGNVINEGGALPSVLTTPNRKQASPQAVKRKSTRKARP